jgi:membrane protease YdiL (CAAX protease family)
MFPLTLYVLVCGILGSMSWALHWGSQSQVLVLLMGLAVFPLQKFVYKAPIKDLGFRKCTPWQAAMGIVLPLVIIGLVALFDLLFGFAQMLPLTELHNPFNASPVSTIWGLTWFLALNAVILFVLEFVTEELMFRGFLLGKLVTLGEMKGLGIASILFGAWHIPIAVWGVGPDPVRTPLYIINMMLLGAVLGLLFLESHSLIPVAAFHALWNSLEYNLFGFLDQRALLIGSSRVLFDPEEGIIGTLFLLAAATVLIYRRRRVSIPARTYEPALEAQ